MKKRPLINIAIFVFFTYIVVSRAYAFDHPPENTCDDICQAEVSCMTYVMAFPDNGDEEIFYLATSDSNIDMVIDFCVHQTGLIITQP